MGLRWGPPLLCVTGSACVLSSRAPRRKAASALGRWKQSPWWVRGGQVSLSAPTPPVLGDASALALLVQLRDAAPRCLQAVRGVVLVRRGVQRGKGKRFQVGQQRAEGVTLFFSSSLQCDGLVGRTWGACPWSLECRKKVWSWQERQGLSSTQTRGPRLLRAPGPASSGPWEGRTR